MTLKNALIAFALTLSSGAAIAQDLTASGMQPSHGPGYRMWQCAAHSTHSEHDIYYGIRSSDRHEAEHSAIEECEYQEGHACAPHGCRRVREFTRAF